MLDLKFVVENADSVKDAMKTRSGEYDVDAVLALDRKRRDILKEVEVLKAERNRESAQVAALKKEKKDASEIIARMKEVGDKIKELDAQLAPTEADLKMALLSIPNIPDKSVPIGKDDTENKEIRKFLTPTKFDFTPKAHWDIGENLKILDPATAAKISGARFTVYRGLGARLERAISCWIPTRQTATRRFFRLTWSTATVCTAPASFPSLKRMLFRSKTTAIF